MKNPNGKESGVTKVTLNGTVLADNYLKASDLQPENDVVVEL